MENRISKDQYKYAMISVVETNHGKYDMSVADVSLLFRDKLPKDYKKVMQNLYDLYKTCKSKRDFYDITIKQEVM